MTPPETREGWSSAGEEGAADDATIRTAEAARRAETARRDEAAAGAAPVRIPRESDDRVAMVGGLQVEEGDGAKEKGFNCDF